MESDFESDSSLLSTPELRLDAGALEGAEMRFAELGVEATGTEDELLEDDETREVGVDVTEDDELALDGGARREFCRETRRFFRTGRWRFETVVSAPNANTFRLDKQSTEIVAARAATSSGAFRGRFSFLC